MLSEIEYLKKIVAELKKRFFDNLNEIVIRAFLKKLQLKSKFLIWILYVTNTVKCEFIMYFPCVPSRVVRGILKLRKD